MRINLPLILATTIVAGSLSTAIVVIDAQSATSLRQDAEGAAKATEAQTPGPTHVQDAVRSTARTEAEKVDIEALNLLPCEDSTTAASCIAFDQLNGASADGWYVVTGDLAIAVRACQGDTDGQCLRPVANPDGTFTYFIA